MTSGEARLSVNVDHVATLRQARRTTYPDPLEAAAIAEAAGAHGITVHLRGDRRHIQDDDVERLRRSVRGKLNLEMAATDEMVEVALRTRPHQCTLVPERPDEVTTEGGLEIGVGPGRSRLLAACERLRAGGIEVSLFIDPDPGRIAALQAFGGLVAGFELNTDAFTRSWSGGAGRAELPGGSAGGRRDDLARCASDGVGLGFKVYAGHGLTAENVGAIASIPEIEELNIGHALISRAVTLGLDGAVREMLTAIRTAR